MPPSQIGIPILSRELIELSARRRTFVLRSLFAASFLGLVFWSQSEKLSHIGSGLFDVLGSGQRLFQELMAWQIGAVVVVMPLITSGAIVNEKHRDTLTLLLTTRVSSFSIILQKLVSRICLMLTLLLVSLPLAAFAYSLGGVDPETIFVHVVCVIVLTVALGSLTIMWSVICSSTTGAFIATLFSAPVLFFPGLCAVAGGTMSVSEATVLPFFGMLPTMFFIAIAADRLRESALNPPKNHFLRLFKALDEIFSDLNQVAGGVLLSRFRRSLPTDSPITWRETEKKALGQPQHLLRIILLLEMPCILILAGMLIASQRAADTSLTPLMAVLWMVSISLIVIRTSGLIAAERSRQTLDVLLTTPLTGAAILKQFAAGLHRLMLALSVPFVTIYLARMAINGFTVATVTYVIISVVTMVIFMLLCTWITLLVGLHVRTQMGTLLSSLAIVLSWIFLPESLGWGRHVVTLIVSPSVLVTYAENLVSGDAQFLLGEGIIPGAMAAGFYTAILIGIRGWCLSAADRCFNRCRSVHAPGIH